MSGRAGGKRDKRTSEGRAKAERSQRLLRDPWEARAQRETERAEEEYWASLAGPVETRYVERDAP